MDIRGFLDRVEPETTNNPAENNPESENLAEDNIEVKDSITDEKNLYRLDSETFKRFMQGRKKSNDAEEWRKKTIIGPDPGIFTAVL